MVFLSISISMECGGGGDIASGAVHRCLLFTTSTLREQFWNILYFEVFRSTFLLTKYLISRFNITDLSVLRVDKIFIIINKRYYVKSGRRIRSTLNRVLQFWNRYCDDDEYTWFGMTRMGKCLFRTLVWKDHSTIAIVGDFSEYCVFITVSMSEQRILELSNSVCRWN